MTPIEALKFLESCAAACAMPLQGHAHAAQAVKILLPLVTEKDAKVAGTE